MSHEADEGHDDHEVGPRPLRVKSSLPVDTERVITRVIGCGIAVHRALGPGYLESIYRRAMCIELSCQGLAYDVERPLRVVYRGITIPGQRVDLLVEGVVVVELKCVKRFDEIHDAQLVSYMKTAGVRAGLLINFQVPLLRNGLRRFVL